MAQLKLENEWIHNKFVKEIFIVNSSQNCHDKDSNAEPLITYDWQGLQPYYWYLDFNG